MDLIAFVSKLLDVALQLVPPASYCSTFDLDSFKNNFPKRIWGKTMAIFDYAQIMNINSRTLMSYIGPQNSTTSISSIGETRWLTCRNPQVAAKKLGCPEWTSYAHMIINPN